MKYKLLLTGESDWTISELFYNSDNRFECMTTSVRNEDIIRHIKYFKPDALVFCLQKDGGNDKPHSFFDVKDECALKNIPIIVVGTKPECDLFNRTNQSMVSLKIMKPISTEQMDRMLIDYLDKNKNSNSNISAFGDDFAGGLFQELPNTKMSTDVPSFGIDNIDAKVNAMINNTGVLGISDIDLLASELEASDLFEEDKKKHILVVDDDKGVLKMLKTVLSDDYDVATALNGKVAMKFLETKSTDLILLDYEMPGERGPEILEKIKANPNLSNIPVVFLTGVTESGKIKEVLAMKPQGYLLKPINMERLNNTIKGILG